MAETKILRYGTTLMPTVVKGIVGSFPGGSVEKVSNGISTQFANISIEGLEKRTVNAVSSSFRYPSVSCILGCTHSYRSLWFWQLKMIKQLGGLAQLRRYMRERVTLGLKFHAIMKKLLSLHAQGKLMEKTEDELCNEHDEMLTNYTRSALPLLRSFDETDKITVEQYVIHPQLYYYGRFDAIIRYKDSFFLIDFKTTTAASLKDGNDLSHLYAGPVQVAAYVGAVNSTPTFDVFFPIRSGAIVIVKEDGSTADFLEISSEELQDYWKRWLERVQRFWYELENRPVKSGAVSFVYDGKKQ